MICPTCRATRVKTLDSRPSDDSRVRRRLCLECLSAWKTREIVVEGSIRKTRAQPAWWADARELSRAGLSQVAIAERLSRSQAMVSRALSPAQRARVHKYQAAYWREPGASEVINAKRRMRAARAAGGTLVGAQP